MIRPEQQELSVARMWTSIPPAVFERAPSTTGLFEQREIEMVGKLLAETVDPAGCSLLLLGSATAFREAAALKVAANLAGKTLVSPKITAVDIAPQLLSVAERRLRLMKQFGIAAEIKTIHGSVGEVNLDLIGEHGAAILGLYDLKCLVNHSQEQNGEPVGLEEYGGGMKEILGTKTRIIPLAFGDDRFQEGESITEYDSNFYHGDFSAVRRELRVYQDNHGETLGMRIYISRAAASDDNPLFVSTWFNLDRLPKAFNSFGLNCQIHSVDARKGVVLKVTGKSENNQKPRVCALVMNNVFGNLATGQVMTDFLAKIQKICQAA